MILCFLFDKLWYNKFFDTLNSFSCTLGDEKGAVLVWDYVQKVCNAWTPLLSMVTILVTSPHSPDITAIGFVPFFGLIFINVQIITSDKFQ